MVSRLRFTALGICAFLSAAPGFSQALPPGEAGPTLAVHSTCRAGLTSQLRLSQIAPGETGDVFSASASPGETGNDLRPPSEVGQSEGSDLRLAQVAPGENGPPARHP